MEFEHKIAQWEKSWGRIKLKNSSLLESLESKKFTMFIGTIPYHSRTIDKQGRIWVGMKALEDFYPGDTIIVELKGDVLHIRKKI